LFDLGPQCWVKTTTGESGEARRREDDDDDEAVEVPEAYDPTDRSSFVKL
jgi:hypothetical protein